MPLKKYIEKGRVEVGCDEAGRGCLAGPVVAAAVVLPEKINLPLLNDSKKLSRKQREELEPLIKEYSLDYGIGVVSPQEIDEVNILNASFLAMHRALDQIQIKFDWIAVDGNRFNAYKNHRHSCEIKGDGRFLHIAAASVLAKTHRDALMAVLHQIMPEYAWEQNKGYPTKKHRKAIADFGATEHHRKSFQLLPKQLKLF